jgi:hypothetical protein
VKDGLLALLWFAALVAVADFVGRFLAAIDLRNLNCL